MAFYTRQTQRRTANPPGTVCRELGRIVFDGLLDGLPRNVVEQQLRDAGATEPEMTTALRRYDTCLSSVVREGGR